MSTKPEAANKYVMLGVPRDASPEQIKLAFRRLALMHHPDRCPEPERAAAEAVFKRIAAAYETLIDPAERKRYDRALDGGYEYRERASTSGPSLFDVLAEIHAFEHIFAEGKLVQLDAMLDQIVQEQLIAELRERIVAVWRMPSAPADIKHQGSYGVGAVVLTNLRVLLPFTYSWVEVRGNIQRTYRGAQMVAIALPALRRIELSQKGRMYRELWVEMESGEQRLRFRSAQRHLGKLLLIAWLWGVPVAVSEPANARAERRRALRRSLKYPLLGALALGGLVVLVGFFKPGSVSGFTAYVLRHGLWQWALLGCAAAMGGQWARWKHAHSRCDLAAALRRTSSKRPGATAQALGRLDPAQ